MKASNVKTALKTFGGFNRLEVINSRWLFVDDGACRFYLDGRSVTQSDFKLLDREDGYSLFCGATRAKHYDELSARSKQDARNAVGAERAKNTHGW